MRVARQILKIYIAIVSFGAALRIGNPEVSVSFNNEKCERKRPTKRPTETDCKIEKKHLILSTARGKFREMQRRNFSISAVFEHFWVLGIYSISYLGRICFGSEISRVARQILKIYIAIVFFGAALRIGNPEVAVSFNNEKSEERAQVRSR